MNRTFHVATRTSLVGVLGVVAITGCGGSDPSSLNSPATTSPYATLFDAPTTKATPDQLAGVWGGTIDRGDMTFDVRLRFADGELTAAARCHWVDGTTLVAGAKGKSRTTPKPEGDPTCFPLGTNGKTSCGEVETLESVTDKRSLGDKWCSISFTPRAYDYRMAGTKARLGFEAESLDLVKISD